MYARNLPLHLIRALTQPRFAATALVTLAALFSATTIASTAKSRTSTDYGSTASWSCDDLVSWMRISASVSILMM